MKILFLFAFTLFAKDLFSIEPINLEKKFSGEAIGLNLEYAEDTLKKITIQDILKESSSAKTLHWEASTKEIPGFGYTNSAYWIKFQIESKNSQIDPIFLEIGYPLIDHISFFLPQETGSYIEKIAGDNLIFQKREFQYRNFIFQIPVTKGKKNYYLRFETQSSMVLPLQLWKLKDLEEKIFSESLILGSYYGILFVMAFFNAFLFLSIRDKTHLTYIALLITLGFFQASLTGHGFQFLYPNSPYIANTAVPVLMFFSLFWIIQFSRHYLNIKKALPRANTFLQIFSLLILVFIISTFFGNYRILSLIAVTTAILIVVYLNVLAIRCLFNKSRSARFYILAWGFMLAGIFIYSLKTLTLLPNNLFTNWSLLIGSTAEITLLSFGLADRMNIINLELTKVKNDLEKMSHVKDLFLSNISHEIRTPLTNIYGYSELIDSMKSKELKSISEYNSEILSSTEDLISYINDLMLVTDIESTPDIKKEKINLLKLAKEIEDPLSKVIGKNKPQIKYKIKSGLTYYSDKKFLKKALAIFIKNAIVYSPPKSEVIISMEKKGNLIVIEITDYGIGIHKNEVEKIFEKFYRVDSSLQYDVGGMGIGLFIAKRIISLLGGKIKLTSELSKGSTFQILLPF